jgi:hypothetical protein
VPPRLPGQAGERQDDEEEQELDPSNHRFRPYHTRSEPCGRRDGLACYSPVNRQSCHAEQADPRRRLDGARPTHYVRGMISDSTVQPVLWPRGRRTVEVLPIAKRLPSLEGKTIAHVWDYMFRGDEIFPILEEALARRFPGVRFVPYEAFGSTHGADEHAVVAALPDKLREHGVDAVISGMAC